MTNNATSGTRYIGSLARLGILIGLVAALLLASQAGTLARERDEMPEDPRRQEMPAERPDEDRPEDPRRDNGAGLSEDPADNGAGLSEDPADNGAGLSEDPADNGAGLSEVELEPIYMD
jgi:hypothetical protein